MNNHKLTLLSREQIYGDDPKTRLEVLERYGLETAVSDFCILTGGYVSDEYVVQDPSLSGLKGRIGQIWTKSKGKHTKGIVTYMFGKIDINISDEVGLYGEDCKFGDAYECAVRPVIQSFTDYSKCFQSRSKGYNGTLEVEYGEYPQYVPNEEIQKELETEFKKDGLKQTGRSYTPNSTELFEYEYKGKLYVRINANLRFKNELVQLSNGVKYKDGDLVWVEVSPVKWLIDTKTETLISKVGLVAGVRYLKNPEKYTEDFNKTLMGQYLEKIMSKDLFQPQILTKNKNETISPATLKLILGSEITNDLASFCQQPKITLTNVINGEYSETDVQSLENIKKYVITIELSQVSEQHVVIVRDFVKKLGAEFVSIFDVLWAQNDKKREALITEIRLNEGQKEKSRK